MHTRLSFHQLKDVTLYIWIIFPQHLKALSASRTILSTSALQQRTDPLPDYQNTVIAAQISQGSANCGSFHSYQRLTSPLLLILHFHWHFWQIPNVFLNTRIHDTTRYTCISHKYISSSLSTINTIL